MKGVVIRLVMDNDIRDLADASINRTLLSVLNIMLVNVQHLKSGQLTFLSKFILTALLNELRTHQKNKTLVY